MANLPLDPVQTSELLPEDVVASTLGIPRKDLAAHRGPEGERWVTGPNRRILWTPTGVEALRAAISGKGAACPENPAAPLPTGATVRLRVLQARVANRRVLLAEPEAGGETVTVYLGRNGQNSLFRAGMILLARPFRGATWIFEGNPDAPQAGRRLPRKPGRW